MYLLQTLLKNVNSFSMFKLFCLSLCVYLLRFRLPYWWTRWYQPLLHPFYWSAFILVPQKNVLRLLLYVRFSVSFFVVAVVVNEVGETCVNVETFHYDSQSRNRKGRRCRALVSLWYRNILFAFLSHSKGGYELEHLIGDHRLSTRKIKSTSLLKFLAHVSYNICTRFPFPATGHGKCLQICYLAQIFGYDHGKSIGIRVKFWSFGYFKGQVVFSIF